MSKLDGNKGLRNWDLYHFIWLYNSVCYRRSVVRSAFRRRLNPLYHVILLIHSNCNSVTWRENLFYWSVRFNADFWSKLTSFFFFFFQSSVLRWLSEGFFTSRLGGGSYALNREFRGVCQQIKVPSRQSNTVARTVRVVIRKMQFYQRSSDLSWTDTKIELIGNFQ